jgi:hypothetical protein
MHSETKKHCKLKVKFLDLTEVIHMSSAWKHITLRTKQREQ